MLADFFGKYKKQWIWAAAALGVLLLGLYLHAMFRPGLWYGDAFLYRQADGSFSGSDPYAQYRMEIASVADGKAITFSVNGREKHYQITTDPDHAEIWEEGVPVFRGHAYRSGDTYLLVDENNEPVSGVHLVVMDPAWEPPTEEQLFPVHSQLYSWAMADDWETRGYPVVLAGVAVLLIILYLDVAFPDLFFGLRHGLEVDGGEPSEFYRFNQKIGRGAMIVGILIFLIIGFVGP